MATPSFWRAVENQKVRKAGYAPHAHAGELSFMHLKRSHSRYFGEVLKGLLGRMKKTARDFGAGLFREPNEVLSQIPLSRTLMMRRIEN